MTSLLSDMRTVRPSGPDLSYHAASWPTQPVVMDDPELLQDIHARKINYNGREAVRELAVAAPATARSNPAVRCLYRIVDLEVLGFTEAPPA